MAVPPENGVPPASKEQRLNPRMLTTAREARGFTQSELAAMAALTQGAISRMESGSLVPSAEALKGLSQALDFPVDFFCSDFVERNLPVTFYRKKKSLSPPALKKVRACVNVQRLHLSQLLAAVEVPEDDLPRVTIEETTRSARDVAREVRLKWNIPRGPIEDLTSLLEEHGVVVVQTDFDTALLDGLSFREPRDTLPPLMFVNSGFPWDRLRFTMAHELGHMILHHHLPLPPEECEVEADAFASEFMMPESDIRGFLGGLDLQVLAQLKTKWRMSMGSILMRAKQLNRLTPEQSGRLWKQMSMNGYRKKEPVDIEPEQPTVLKDMLKMYLSSLENNEEELAKAIQCSMNDLHKLYHPFLEKKMRALAEPR